MIDKIVALLMTISAITAMVAAINGEPWKIAFFAWAAAIFAIRVAMITSENEK